MTSLVKFASILFVVGVTCNKITEHDTSAASKENAIDLQTRSAQYRYQPSSDEDDDEFYDTHQERRYTNPWFRNHPKTKSGYDFSPPYRSFHDFSPDVRPFQRPKYHHHHHHHSRFQPWEFYPDNESEEVTSFRPTTVKQRPVVTTPTTTTTTIIPQIDIRIGRKRRSILQP